MTRRSATQFILGRTLDTLPSHLDLVRRCPVCGSSDHGRPSVRDSSVEFSVSSSAGLAALAVSLNPVGVDIELDHGVSPAVGQPVPRGAPGDSASGSSRTAWFTVRIPGPSADGRSRG